jgi:hypothetical protein
MHHRVEQVGEMRSEVVEISIARTCTFYLNIARTMFFPVSVLHKLVSSSQQYSSLSLHSCKKIHFTVANPLPDFMEQIIRRKLSTYLVLLSLYLVKGLLLQRLKVQFRSICGALHIFYLMYKHTRQCYNDQLSSPRSSPSFYNDSRCDFGQFVVLYISST